MLTLTHSFKSQGIRIPRELRLMNLVSLLTKFGYTVQQDLQYRHRIWAGSELLKTTLNWNSYSRDWELILYRSDIESLRDFIEDSKVTYIRK